MSTETKVQASIGRETYKTQINIREHHLIGDEMMDNGGKDLGPTSSELVLAGFATCTASTLRMYADRKGWPVEKIFVELTLVKEKTNEGLSSNIFRAIRIEGNIDDEQKQRMLEIAEKCPVHRMLTNPIRIKTQIIS
jgi:putative redox protein